MATREDIELLRAGREIAGDEWDDEEQPGVSALVGLTLDRVETVVNDRSGRIDEIWFVTTCGRVFGMYHSRDCCETVDVEDICGDLPDLIGSPIVRAEERSEDGGRGPEDEDGICVHDSSTWTFYEIATNRGSVTVRWLGVSNGYYSEKVSFFEFVPEEKEDEVKPVSELVISRIDTSSPDATSMLVVTPSGRSYREPVLQRIRVIADTEVSPYRMSRHAQSFGALLPAGSLKQPDLDQINRLIGTPVTAGLASIHAILRPSAPIQWEA